MGYVRVISYNLYHSPLTKVLLTSSRANHQHARCYQEFLQWMVDCILLEQLFFCRPKFVCWVHKPLVFFFRVEATDTFEQKVLIHRRKLTAGTQTSPFFGKSENHLPSTSMIEFHDFFFQGVYSKNCHLQCTWQLCGGVNRSTAKTLGAPIRPLFLKVNPTKQGRNSNP